MAICVLYDRPSTGCRTPNQRIINRAVFAPGEKATFREIINFCEGLLDSPGGYDRCLIGISFGVVDG